MGTDRHGRQAKAISARTICSVRRRPGDEAP